MPSRKKKILEEYEERVKQSIAILSMISEDRTTPRNIRRVAKNALDMLGDDSMTRAVKAANVISILDDISQDPNMPPYTRTRIWNIVSLLEVIKE
jgi:uncharacterized protein (UPF0147 family)